jgi:hypothetical protein
MKIKLWHVAAAAAVYYGVSTIKNTISNLQYTFISLKIDWAAKWQDWKDLKFFTPLRGKLRYDIFNPTSSNVLVKSFRGKLYYGSYPLTNLSISETNLTPNETKNLTIDIDIPILMLAAEIQEIIKSKWLLYQFGIKGKVVFQVDKLPVITKNISQNIQLADPYDPTKTT